MEKNKFNWDTEFNTAENLMIHTFSDRVKVVTNIKTGEVKTMRDDEIIGRRSDLLISDYERYLIAIAQDAAKLQEFNA